MSSETQHAYIPADRRSTSPLRSGETRASVLLIAAAAILPFFLSDYRTFQLTLALAYAIALLGLNILTGYSGQISLGHGAFFADRRLCRGDHDGSMGNALLVDDPGRGRRMPGCRISVRPACLAPGGTLSRACDLRARGRDAADPQIQGDRGMDWRRTGHRHHQARCAVRVADKRRIAGSICSRLPSRW